MNDSYNELELTEWSIRPVTDCVGVMQISPLVEDKNDYFIFLFSLPHCSSGAVSLQLIHCLCHVAGMTPDVTRQ